MDSEQLAGLQARLDALEAENSKLKSDAFELSAELGLWKPSQKVEIAKPADRRNAKDFVNPKINVRQFGLNEAAAMDEGDLLRAVTNHLNEQIPNLSAALPKLIENAKLLYCKGIASAIKGRHIQIRKDGYRNFSHGLILEKFGFVPFVSDTELKAAIF